MITASAAPNRPDDLPIWARLNLAEQDVQFDGVVGWERDTATRICAWLDNGRYVYLYKR